MNDLFVCKYIKYLPFFPMYKMHFFSGKIMSNWGVRLIHRYKEKTFFFKIENY